METQTTTETNITDDEFETMLENFIAKELGDEAILEYPEVVEIPAERPEDEEYSIMKSLSHLTGLKSVKDKLAGYEKLVKFNKMRRDNDLPEVSLSLHAMFLGSPGTGKTTVAKRMGFMLRRAGMLSKGHVVVRERATLLGQYYSSEGEKTLEAIEEARGGILLIDEAYQLFQSDDARDPGKFVIETLMTALADESRRDWMLILAGYPDKMRRMFEMNPGLKSRIPESNIYVFEDFTEAELMEIAERYFSRNSYTLSDDARLALSERLGSDYRSRTASFGNARHVMNLIQTEILPAMATRIVDGACTNLCEIIASDIPLPASTMTRPTRKPIGYRA